MDTLFSIYALSDPRTPENTRYIGKTTQKLERRLNAHCKDFRGHNHRTSWGNQYCLGNKASPETKAKRSAAHIKRWQIRKGKN